MATRADDLKNAKAGRTESGTKASVRPPLPAKARSVDEIIKRSVAKHPRVLELLAKR